LNRASRGEPVGQRLLKKRRPWRKKTLRSLSKRMARLLAFLGLDPAKWDNSPTARKGAGVASNLPSLMPRALQPFTEYANPEPFERVENGTAWSSVNTRVCCLLHLYYIDLWTELAADLRNLQGLEHDVFLNFVETTVTDELLAQARADFPAARISVSPNRGRDAGGILRLARQMDAARYGSVLVLHGKRSAALPEEQGEQWRRTLIDPLIGSPAIAELNVALMASDPTVGLIASAACRSTFIGENRRTLIRLARLAGIPRSCVHAPFVAGTMFFIKPELMARLSAALQGLDFAPPDSAAASGVKDGLLEHAVERIYGAAVAARGERIAWRDTRVTRVDLSLGR
jgi:lipopolysaccharide biosynthesis protein